MNLRADLLQIRGGVSAPNENGGLRNISSRSVPRRVPRRLHYTTLYLVKKIVQKTRPRGCATAVSCVTRYQVYTTRTCLIVELVALTNVTVSQDRQIHLSASNARTHPSTHHPATHARIPTGLVFLLRRVLESALS